MTKRPRKKPSSPLERVRKYEASGKRPGTPVGTRLSDEELRILDEKRGDESRSAWVLRVIRRALGIKG